MLSSRRFRFLQRIVNQAADTLQHPGIPPSPGIAALFRTRATQDMYITFANGRIYLVTAQAPTEARMVKRWSVCGRWWRETAASRCPA